MDRMGNGAHASASPVGPSTGPPTGARGPDVVSRWSSQVAWPSFWKPVPVSVPPSVQSEEASVAVVSSMEAVTVTR